MVGLDDRGVAPRGGADVVAEHQHPPPQSREDAAAGVHRDEVAAVRGGVQTPEPRGRRPGPTPPGPGDGRRNRPVSRDPCGLVHRSAGVTEAQEGSVGHHEVDLERLDLTGRQPGDEPRRRVGHHRTEPTTVGRLVGALPAEDGRRSRADRGERTHDVAQRGEHGEVCHPVRSRPDGDAAGRGGGLDTPHDGGRIELGRDPPRRPPEGTGRQSPEQAGQPQVDLPAVLPRQDRRLAHQLERAPLDDGTPGEGGQGLGHLVHQRPGQPDPAVTARAR